MKVTEIQHLFKTKETEMWHNKFHNFNPKQDSFNIRKYLRNDNTINSY